MGLRFDPVGGGQFKEAVKQIMEAESQPLKQLQVKKTREEARMKLFQEFKSKFSGLDKALGEMSNFKKFRELKVDMGDGTNVADVVLDKELAQPGVYQIEVNELARRTSVLSNGFTNPDEPVLGMGFIVMESPKGEKLEIFVDESASSLRGLADKINTEKDSPIRAAVVKDAGDTDTPWRLIMTAKNEGAQNQLDFPDFYFLDGEKDFYIQDDKPSKNALIKMDGFELELDSNKAKDFLPGVNLNLKQARPDQPFTMTITEDTAKVAGKVKGLVEEINKVFKFINEQNAIDEKTDTRTTFAGDTSLQAIEYRLRNLMHEGFPVGNPESEKFRLVFLNQVGVEFDKTGQLTFKEDKFQKALENDFNGVSEAVTGDFGFVFQLKEVLSQYTRIGSGTLAVREQGIRARIKAIDDQIETKTRNLDRRQQALTEQFSRLQGSLSNLQRQQQYLQAALPSGGGGNLVQQLLGG